MPKAVWKNTIIASSEDTILLEGNHYFPPDTVHREYLRESRSQAAANWMGTPRLYHVVVGVETVEDAAWSYSEPTRAATAIKDHVAFFRGVTILQDP
ncbi:MAG: DUF427 domain-containing protein [bacterium]|nr:MAG: DUF427 domain-containing protein [bacterium]